MEKYQDLIVTLIKNHRRYSGCEDILDKIVEDVMERAKDVINSVEDESIITKYLTKIVSAAMITVPKQYNICPDIKRKSHEIENTEQIVLQEKQQETSVPEIDEVQLMESLESSPIQEEADNTAIYDSIKNSLEFDENEYTDELNQEDIISEETADNLIEFDDNETESIQETEPLIDTMQDEDLTLENIGANPVVETEEETEEKEEIEFPQSSEGTGEDVNKELVDKMINGNDSEHNDFQNISEKIDGLSALYGEPEEEIENIDSVFEEEPSAEEKEINHGIEEQFEIEDNLELTEETDAEPLSEIETEVAQDYDSSFEELATLSEEESDEYPENDIEDLQEESHDTQEGILSAEEIDFSETDTLYLSSDNTEEEISEKEVEEDFELSNNSSDLVNFNPPNISCFNFPIEDSEDEFDEYNEIGESIKAYADKNSELPIMEIWKLKYCQNKSISQISSELNLPKEDILNVMEELIDAAER